MVLPYLSSVVRAPAADADGALLRVAADLRARRSPSPDAWTVAVAGATLTLDGRGVRPEAPRPDVTWQVRRVAGVLVAGRARVRVEVELEPWSERWSELGIRVVHRAHRMPRDRYVRAAAAALALLVGEIEGWLAESLFTEDARAS